MRVTPAHPMLFESCPAVEHLSATDIVSLVRNHRLRLNAGMRGYGHLTPSRYSRRNSVRRRRNRCFSPAQSRSPPGGARTCTSPAVRLDGHPENMTGDRFVAVYREVRRERPFLKVSKYVGKPAGWSFEGPVRLAARSSARQKSELGVGKHVRPSLLN